jgi:hypothetical protein
VKGLFFCARRSFGPGPPYDELGVLVHQCLELPVVGGVLCHAGDLVCGNIEGEGFALFPALQVVIPGSGVNFEIPCQERPKVEVCASLFCSSR